MAAVEFEKNQCYFAGALQIAALAFMRLQRTSPRGSAVAPGVMDASLVVMVSINGCIPIISGPF